MSTDTKNYDIEWLQWFDEKAKTDIFYCEGYEHSPVCIIKGNNRQVLVSCDGEMNALFIDNDGEEHRITDYWGLVNAGIKTDFDLEKLKDKIEWDMTPWFNAYDITEDYQEDLGPDNSGVNLEMVSGTIDEILQKVEGYMKETDK